MAAFLRLAAITSPPRPRASSRPRLTVVEASGTGGADGPKARNDGPFRPVSTVWAAPNVPAPVEANSVMLLARAFAANRSPRASKARPSGPFRPPARGSWRRPEGARAGRRRTP